MLVFEKGFEPKKLILAEKGDGWDDLITKCLELLIYCSYFSAFLPQSIKTRGWFSLVISLNIFSVNVSQPRLACDNSWRTYFDTKKSLLSNKSRIKGRN